MKLKWHGHSCFELTLDNGAVIVTDPFDATVGYPLCEARADVALCSHGHFDHNYTASLRGAPQVITEPGEYALCGARITGVPSFHDDAGGAKRGENVIFTIEADGKKIVHLGDLGHLPDTEAQRRALSGADVLLVPIGGHFTIDTPTAVALIREVKPRAAIAMHFKNRYCQFPVSDEGEFMRLTRAQRLPNVVEITDDAPTGCGVMDI